MAGVPAHGLDGEAAGVQELLVRGALVGRVRLGLGGAPLELTVQGALEPLVGDLGHPRPDRALEEHEVEGLALVGVLDLAAQVGAQLIPGDRHVPGDAHHAVGPGVGALLVAPLAQGRLEPELLLVGGERDVVREAEGPAREGLVDHGEPEVLAELRGVDALGLDRGRDAPLEAALLRLGVELVVARLQLLVGDHEPLGAGEGVEDPQLEELAQGGLPVGAPAVAPDQDLVEVGEGDLARGAVQRGALLGERPHDPRGGRVRDDGRWPGGGAGGGQRGGDEEREGEVLDERDHGQSIRAGALPRRPLLAALRGARSHTPRHTPRRTPHRTPSRTPRPAPAGTPDAEAGGRAPMGARLAGEGPSARAQPSTRAASPTVLAPAARASRRWGPRAPSMCRRRTAPSSRGWRRAGRNAAP